MIDDTYEHMFIYMICWKVKGSDAAATTGTEATVYAAEATSYNELLEKFLPATVSDYVDLVQAHITMGM